MQSFCKYILLSLVIKIGIVFLVINIFTKCANRKYPFKDSSLKYQYVDLSSKTFYKDSIREIEIYELVLRELIYSKIACPECISIKKITESPLLDKNEKKRLKRNFKTLKKYDKIRVSRYLFLMNNNKDSVGITINKIPFSFTDSTSVLYDFFEIRISTSYSSNNTEIIKTEKGYRSEGRFKPSTITLGGTYIYDPVFTVGISKRVYLDSSLSQSSLSSPVSSFKLPPLLLCEDLVNYKMAYKFLWNTMFNKATMIDTNHLKEYLYICSFPDFKPENMRVVQRNNKSSTILFYAPFLLTEVKAVINIQNGLIDYKIIENNKYLENLIEQYFRKRIEVPYYSTVTTTLTSSNKKTFYFNIEVTNENDKNDKYKGKYSKDRITLLKIEE